MAVIYVIDDDESIAELITTYMHRQGHYVRKAHDGESCLRLTAQQKPDLIILDVMMPGMNGYAVCSKLLANQEMRNVPVIILTARGKMRDMFAMQTNVAAYLEKPFDPDHLVGQVKKILETWKR